MSMPYYVDTDACQHLCVGPINPYIGTFAQQLVQQGYAPQTVRTKLNTVATFSVWLQHHQLSIDAVDEHCVSAFFRDRADQRQRIHRGNSATLQALVEHLRTTGVIPAPSKSIDTSVIGQLERDFSQYLRQERGLSAATLDNGCKSETDGH